MDGLKKLIERLDPCRDKSGGSSSRPEGAEKFAEPWHAQVFGLSLALSQAGHFEWERWVKAFSTEIRANPQTTEETSEEAYYRQWLAALTELLSDSGMLDERALTGTAEDWRRSFLHTEHGKPIIFRRGLNDLPHHDHHDHNHGDHRAIPAPVAISPAG